MNFFFTDICQEISSTCPLWSPSPRLRNMVCRRSRIRGEAPWSSKVLVYLWVKNKPEDRYILVHFVTYSVTRNKPELTFKIILRSERVWGSGPPLDTLLHLKVGAKRGCGQMFRSFSPHSLIFLFEFPIFPMKNYLVNSPLCPKNCIAALKIDWGGACPPPCPGSYEVVTHCIKMPDPIPV